MIALLLATLALAGPRAAPGGNAADSFAAAGKAYEAGRLPEARTRYERLLAVDEGGAAACYNLGNTWWRLNRRGQAVLWWERARRLAPRDEDIRFNLALARTAAQDDDLPVGDILDRLLTPVQLWWLVTALAWAVGAASGAGLWRGLPPARWRVALTCGLPALALLGGWLAWRTADLARSRGVVDVPQVEVRSGPGDQFPVGFTIPDGHRVLVVNRRPGWIEIGVPARSLKGWVPVESIGEF